jgi:hypothetical protein
MLSTKCRKLEEMGYQKSPQECKEKLESIQNSYRQGVDMAGN